MQCNLAWHLLGRNLDMPRCCDSCHEDEGLGFAGIERQLPDGSYVEVCCEISNSIDTVNPKSEEVG